LKAITLQAVKWGAA